MADIYQAIWNADQAYAGVRAVRRDTAVTDAMRAHGYVVVDERQDAGPDHRLLSEVEIPDAKAGLYKLVEKLFNNYTLDQTKRENVLPEEDHEVQAFIEVVHRSPPMEVAREYVSRQAGMEVTPETWWSILQRAWFERFDLGGNRDLSGFEHVVVGEQKQSRVQGYHFWYKYFLDEHFRVPGEPHERDLIEFINWESTPGELSPDVVTLSYRWRAFDYEARAFRTLTKPIGGFWVGPSIVGLMAIGTVRFLADAMAPKVAAINGAMYRLKMFRSPNDRNLRTFYPEFVETTYARELA